VTEQPEYNLFARDKFEKEYARLFRDYGYGSTTWSPLASGLLTGKYGQGLPDDSRARLKGYDWLQKRMSNSAKLAKVQALKGLADKAGCTLAQLALAWVLQNPHVSTVITGASRVEQIRENMAASGLAAQLEQGTIKEIEDLFGGPAEDDD
jgi:aryl-alcohol dehydrogenase-like predicted oxidoreductase